MLVTILKLLAVIVVGYGLGNISVGMIISKQFAHVDIRQKGSKSTGATNVFRVLGAKASAVTLVGDAMKGALAALFGLWLLGDSLTLGSVVIDGRVGMYLGGIAAVCGHMWPIVYRFKGGKGVATCLGVAIAVDPLAALIMFAVTLVMIFTIRVVSVASLSIMLIYAAYYIFFYWGDWPLGIFALTMCCLVFYAHRANIKRILAGTERYNKLCFTKKQKQQAKAEAAAREAANPAK